MSGAEMKKSSSSGRSLILLLLLVVLIGGLAAVVIAMKNQPAAPIEASSNAVAAAPVFSDAGDKLLVWTGQGAGPGQHSAANPGQIVFMDGTGATTPVMDVPPQTTRVMACGDEASSPDGSKFAFYMGLDSGTLYMMNGADTPQRVADVHALACLGNGTFQWSPDSARYGYIAYEPGAEASEFADGFLKIMDSRNQSELLSAENVVAFDMNNDGAAYVSFFTNDKNEADEAAVIWWNGSAERELATLRPNAEDCKFSSASMGIAPDGSLVLVMGHRCKSGDTRTSWQLYTVEPESRTTTLAASDFQPGLFASFARTNNLYFSPDGQWVFFTVPDGVTANTVGVKAVQMSDMSISDVVERSALMPTYSGNANAFPAVSPDGKWLAFVETTPNNDNSLYLTSLVDPNIAPIVIEAGSRGDTVSALAFTSDSSRLVFVSGGDNSANNSLSAVELNSGNDFRLSRGRFGAGLALAPNGSEVVVTDWQVVEDPKEPPYLNLITVNVDSSETTMLFTGGEVVDGKVTNQRFATPLTWRRP
ncbi:MAG: PD40 domain-containing protein [Anaerolineaceae bacterium]|nr:PD40 domain-containing protein [Anaerolineaceae bacterium]